MRACTLECRCLGTRILGQSQNQIIIWLRQHEAFEFYLLFCKICHKYCKYFHWSPVYVVLLNYYLKKKTCPPPQLAQTEECEMTIISVNSTRSSWLVILALRYTMTWMTEDLHRQTIINVVCFSSVFLSPLWRCCIQSRSEPQFLYEHTDLLLMSSRRGAG